MKDKTTGDIVFFFALNAGLLYKAIGDDDYELTQKEREIINLCIECQLDATSSYTEDEVFSWYADESLDKNRLIRIIEEKVQVKLSVKADQSEIEDGVNIMRVSQTFPGIVLTHFCRNEKYTFPERISFPLGFYVFWEIIVDRILCIASILGCQYLYLFAADNTDCPMNMDSAINYIDADIFDESDDSNESVQTYKLVEYYKNELKFEEVQGMTIVKPYYDFKCFSLIQSIQKLSDNRTAAWIQHSDIER